jgi:hypothetical protein
MWAYARIALELARLLDGAFVPGTSQFGGPVGQDLANVLRLHNAGLPDQRDWELTKLALLADNLALSRRTMPTCWTRFGRSLEIQTPILISVLVVKSPLPLS